MMTTQITLQQIILRIKHHGPSYKVEQLCLDQIPICKFTIELNSYLEKCTRLQYLSLCDCQLVNLNNLPVFPNIQILQLTHNQLQGEHLQLLSRLTKLYSLALDFNKISDLSWPRFLKRNRISNLSLKGNPICLEADFRERTYRALGADLQILDGVDRKGNAAAQSDSSQSQQESEEDEQDFKMNQSEMREGQNQSQASIQENSVSIESDIDEEQGYESSKKIKKNQNQSQ